MFLNHASEAIYLPVSCLADTATFAAFLAGLAAVFAFFAGVAAFTGLAFPFLPLVALPFTGDGTATTSVDINV